MVQTKGIQALSTRAVIWLFVLVFVIHDGEEILTTEGWVKAYGGLLLQKYPSAGPLLEKAAQTTAQFSVTVMFLFVIVLAVCYWAARAPRPGAAVNAFTALLLVLAGNVVTHVGSTLLMGSYTPGVVTAVLVALPYCVFAIRRLVQEGLFTRRSVLMGLLSGALAVAPVLAAVHLAGRWLAP